MSRLALAAGAAAVVYGIGLTALRLRWWPTPSVPRTRIQPTRNTTMLNPQLEQLQHDCPNCGCCTAALCRKAVVSLRGCQAHTPKAFREMVAACPCSARAVAAAGVWNITRVGGPNPAASVGPASLVGCIAAVPGDLVAVREVTTTTAAVYRVWSADVVRVAGGEPW